MPNFPPKVGIMKISASFPSWDGRPCSPVFPEGVYITQHPLLCSHLTTLLMSQLQIACSLHAPESQAYIQIYSTPHYKIPEYPE